MEALCPPFERPALSRIHFGRIIFTRFSELGFYDFAVRVRDSCGEVSCVDHKRCVFDKEGSVVTIVRGRDEHAIALAQVFFAEFDGTHGYAVKTARLDSRDEGVVVDDLGAMLA